MTVHPDGSWAQTPDSIGAEWPQGSGQHLILEAGHYVGAIKYGQPSVSSVETESEYQPGDILNDEPGDDLEASDPADPANRVYVIDGSHTGTDWDEWPAGKGAPVDSGGHPALVSDQDSWTVMNDLNEQLHGGTTEPILGLNVQRSTYGWTDGDVEDAVMVQWRLRNMSTNTYTQTYFGIWMDPDIVLASNDLVGVDLDRQMAFAYNANDADAPVALGIDLLQGPAGTDGEPVPLCSFTRITQSTNPGNDYQRFQYLRGFTLGGGPRPGGPFDFAGDPVSGVGAIDTVPSDRRLLMGVGPFRLAPGESRDVIAAIVASAGADRLDAIVKLREADDRLQEFFDQNLPASVELVAGGIPSQRSVISSCVPNPFGDRSVIRYWLPSAGPVRLDVVDLQGRRIRELLPGERVDAGSRQAIWDGRDTAGRPVASGVYTLRLRLEGQPVASKRVVVLR
jgi:hypothetical protein